MKIKKRGWIGGKCVLEDAVTERGEDIIIGVSKEKDIKYGFGGCPPKEVEVTIEVKEVPLCDWGYRGKDRKKKPSGSKSCSVCGKPYNGGSIQFDSGGPWIHEECIPEKKIKKLDGPGKFGEIGHRYILNMKERINEIIDRLNETKPPPVDTRPVCCFCNESIEFTDKTVIVEAGVVHAECHRRKL